MDRHQRRLRIKHFYEDEAARKLGRAVFAALDRRHDTPAHKAARRMIEELIEPYLSGEDYVQNVANFASWSFAFWDEERRIDTDRALEGTQADASGDLLDDDIPL